MDIIYIDEIFLVNALADYVLLLSAATLRSLPLKRGRFALAAVLGALYAVLAALPPLLWLRGGSVKLAVSLLMSALAFGTEGLLRSWLTFLLLSAAFAGAFLGLGRLGRGSVHSLLIAFALLYALLRLLLARQLETRQLLDTEVTLRERSVRFRALHDTGNALFDPVSGLHVLIAESAALSPLFPCALSGDAAGDFRLLSEHARCRLLPYRSVGGSGLLLCFRPDKLTLDGEAKELLVGLSPAPFGENGEYRAIV